VHRELTTVSKVRVPGAALASVAANSTKEVSAVADTKRDVASDAAVRVAGPEVHAAGKTIS